MPKSKQRKNHKKKVQSRNKMIKEITTKQTKLLQDAMKEQLEVMRQKFSAETEENQVSDEPSTGLI